TGTAPGRRWRRAAANALGLAFAALMAFPLYWMLLTAFRPATEIHADPPHFWPDHLTLEHFRRALGTSTFWANARSSVLIGVGTVLVSLLFGTLAAFALARFSFAGRRALVLVVLGVQMIP